MVEVRSRPESALGGAISVHCIRCAPGLGNPLRQHSPPVRGEFMRRFIAATAAGSLAVAAALVGALPASAADTAEVYVVHGIPNLPVDVYVNGALTLNDFQPETVAGPLDLPAGSYSIAVTAME